MPIRTVKQYSDRGSIKNIAKGEVPDTYVPSASEVRLKSLYEYAQKNKDQNLQSAMGFITTDYIGDKNAIPLSVYRIRQMVADIKAKSAGEIDTLSQELSQYFGLETTPEAKAYWDQKNSKGQVKTASVRKPPSFWRARKS